VAESRIARRLVAGYHVGQRGAAKPENNPETRGRLKGVDQAQQLLIEGGFQVTAVRTAIVALVNDIFAADCDVELGGSDLL
jgi:hypothetical protein